MNMNNKKARVIAFYLPQFHPIPENDKWWGKGFTEWTNVGKAKPLFKGHYQPRIPADLGYYDLRMPEIREAQAEMAREAGIEGFCYWHYWFGNGKMLLERPFYEVLESGKPDFPFCLGWANHSWTTKTWENVKGSYKENIIAEQCYLGDEDYMMHFNYVLKAFKDKRYITVDGMPLFYIFAPMNIPNVSHFINLWQKMAKQNGLKGIYFVASRQSRELKEQTIWNTVRKKIEIDAKAKYQECFDLGFDGVNSRGEYMAEFHVRSLLEVSKRWLMRKLFNKATLTICKQSDINKFLYVDADRMENVYPTLIPNFDRSPRAGKRAHIYVDSSPKLFKEQIRTALCLIEGRAEEHRILFLQSWNEWAEGNYVEPDLRYGHGYLDVLKDMIIC